MSSLVIVCVRILIKYLFKLLEKKMKKKNEEEVVVGDTDDLDFFFSFLCSDCFVHCHHDVFVQGSLILIDLHVAPDWLDLLIDLSSVFWDMLNGSFG